MTPNRPYHFDTLQVRAGSRPDPTTGAVMPPIYQTTAYVYESTDHAAALFSLEQSGYIYSRLQNPTNAVLEERLSALEGGVGAVVFSSGHAALFNTVLNLCEAGDEVVCSRCVYGGVINMLGMTFSRIGIGVRWVDPGDFSGWEEAVTDKTRLFFVEQPSNPHGDLVDLEAIAAIAHRHGVPLMVDGTLATPALHRPIEFGADLVLHSTTKSISGNGTAMGGVIIDSGNFDWDNPRFPLFQNPDPSYHGKVFAKDFGNAGFIVRLRALMLRDTGSCQAPFHSFLTLLGVETLSLRMRRHAENAQAVAEFLHSHPKVVGVHFPGLPGDASHELMKKYFPNGCGPTFSFELAGGRAGGAQFLDALGLVLRVSNLGDSRTLCIHPATTTHSQLSDEQLALAGITPGTVRISVGLEDPGDVIWDLEQALEKVSG